MVAPPCKTPAAPVAPFSACGAPGGPPDLNNIASSRQWGGTKNRKYVFWIVYSRENDGR